MNKTLIADDITNPALNQGLQDATWQHFFGQLLPNMVSLGFVIGILIFFFIMIIGGVQWITSGGDKASLEAARSKISNALVGIIVLFALFAVIKVLQDFFGISILSLDIGTLKIQ